MTLTGQETLSVLLRQLSKELHATSRGKGWWHDRDKLALTKAGQVHVDIGCLALCITELSEAIENVRAGYTPDDKVPQYSGLEAELADTIIRIMDFAAARNLNVVGALFAKSEMNKGRAHRHGGKLA